MPEGDRRRRGVAAQRGTIPYVRIDSSHDAPRSAFSNTPYRAAATRAALVESRPAIPGCACRCRSRSTTSTCGCLPKTTATRSSIAATAMRRPARYWREHISRRHSIGRPIRRIVATHCHPDHLGNAAWLAERFGCPVAMTHGEFLTAHAIVGRAAQRFARRSICALSAATAWPPNTSRALDARGNQYRRGVPEAPASFDRLSDGDTIRTAGGSWRSSKAMAIRRSMRRLRRAQGGC